MSPKINMLHAVAGALDASDNALAILEWREGGLFILEINDAFCRMGEYTPDRLLGCDFAQIISPESEPELKRLYEAASQGQACRCELLALARRGGRYWFGMHSMPAAVTAERAGLFVVLGRDITARRAEAEQSAAVQSLLARVFMSADVPISILDAENCFAMVNEAHESLLGGRSADWAGRQAMDMVDPASRARVLAAQQAHVKSGAPFRVEVDLLTLDGHRVPVQLTSRTVVRSDHRKFRIVTAIPDPLRVMLPSNVKMHGKLRLVSLAEVRAHLGDQYKSMAARVAATAVHVLEHRLDSRDSFVPTPEGDYCVVFAGLDEDEAMVRAAALGHEIRTKLIGEEMAAMVEVDQSQPLSPLLLTRLRAVAGGEISTHFVRLCLGQGGPGASDSIVMDGSHLQRDLMCLRTALDQLREGGRLLVPVEFAHFMERASTDRFFGGLREVLTDPHAAHNLIVMLDHLPRGLAIGRLMDVVQRIKPLGAAVGILLDDLHPPTMEIPDLWVGIDARRYDGGAGFPPLALKRLCLQWHASRGKVWIRHAAPQVAKQLVVSGVNFISLEVDEP